MGADIYNKARNGDYTYNSTTGRLENYGKIKKSEISLLNGGRDFSVGDEIILGGVIDINETLVTQIDNSFICFHNSIVVSAGKVTKIKILSTLNDFSFKIGTVVKVYYKKGTNEEKVVFIRINLVEDRTGGWRSAFNEGITDDSITLTPTNNPINGTSGNILIMDDYSITLRETYGRAAMWGDWDYDAAADVTGIGGSWGIDQTILFSSSGWPDADFTEQDFSFEVQRRTESDKVTIRVTEVGDSFGDIKEFSVVNPSNTNTTTLGDVGGFFLDLEDINYRGGDRGQITYVDIMNTNAVFDPKLDVTTTWITTKTGGVDAQLTPSFGVLSVTVNNDNRGTGYTTAPVITIDPPLHRTLKTQGVARSAKLYKLHDKITAESYGLKILNKGAGYTGRTNIATDEFGVYQLVGGNLHQTGSSANSTDTIIRLKYECFDTNGRLIIEKFKDSANIDVLLEGSNYQVGDVLTLVPIGITTTNSNVNPIPIRFEVLDDAVSDWIDHNDQKDTTSIATFIPNGNNILDSGVIDEATNYDVGGYGTGYVVTPKIRIVGGDQGVKVATTLGLTNVDFLSYEARGNAYKIDDKVILFGGGFSSPKLVGYVNRVSDKGEILSIYLYEPYISCDINSARIEVSRSFTSLIDATNYATSLGLLQLLQATLTPVFGVTNVITTIKPSGGFLGKGVVKVDSPTGYGNIIQPLVSEIRAIFQHEVSKVSVLQDEDVPPLYRITSNPEISIDTPLGGGIADLAADTSLFNGWRTMRFNRNDSFEFIVQYVIGKAIAFQVDPDVSLPSSYAAADKIKIGGVTIPLRPPGAKGFMGREMSANRIIRRYRIKLIGV
jgi:hypothetical protein